MGSFQKIRNLGATLFGQTTKQASQQVGFSDQNWHPTHRHSKGGMYRVLARGLLEADLTPMVIYDDIEGKIWIRPVVEFDDGRFQSNP